MEKITFQEFEIKSFLMRRKWLKGNSEIEIAFAN